MATTATSAINVLYEVFLAAMHAYRTFRCPIMAYNLLLACFNSFDVRIEFCIETFAAYKSSTIGPAQRDCSLKFETASKQLALLSKMLNVEHMNHQYRPI
jgi:hypothetical protein